MKKRVKAAILGTGFIGRVHLEALCRLGFVEVAALVTRRHTVRRSVWLASTASRGSRPTTGGCSTTQISR